MDSKRVCIFCNSDKLSKEHIYPKWLFDFFQTSEPTFQPSFHLIERSDTNAISDSMKSDYSDGREIPYDNFTVKNVCETCNNTWMSEIEGKVQRILTPYITDNSKEINISSEDANILSQWAVLKCMLVSLAIQQKVFFSKQAYTLIKNAILPEGFMIELATMKYSKLNFMVGGVQLRKSFDITRDELDLAMNNFYKASLQIGFIAFRVTFLRTEIPVFRKQIQKRLFVLYPYNSKLPFEEHPEINIDRGPDAELPYLNSLIAIID